METLGKPEPFVYGEFLEPDCLTERSETSMLYHYTIPLPPRTKKNSQRILRSKKGIPFIVPSEAFTDYQEAAGYFLKPLPATPINTPVQVKCLFYLPKNLRADLVNYQEAICDILVHYGIVADDRWQIISSMDGSRCLVDRENPRTEIWISDFEST